MLSNQPSLTARGAAAHRAAHQTLEGGRVFTDPFACVILGEEPRAIAEREAAEPQRRPMRLFVTARTRFAEDALSVAVTARGVRQVIVLGAGLDTFALRNPHAHLGLRVFEVDHSATQAWKRERLAEAGLRIPDSLTFVSVDFEREKLSEALRAAGFCFEQPGFFLWLGVVPYLTRDAIFATLRFVAGLSNSEVAFDYSEPPDNYPPERRVFYDRAAKRVATLGEPWLSHFDPAELGDELERLGFGELEDLSLSEMVVRYFGEEENMGTRGGGGPHVIRARRMT